MIRGNKSKLSAKTQAWIAIHKRRGQEVRFTKNGHPFAVLRTSVVKKDRKR